MNMLQCGFCREGKEWKRRWGEERMRGEGAMRGRGTEGRNGKEDEVKRERRKGNEGIRRRESLGVEVERK